jgi:hypothetical protein
MNTREGGCQCQAVRYRISGEPLVVYACHCTDCQRRSGSAFGMSMIVRREQLEVRIGAPRVYDFVETNGRHRRGAFCERCAVRLWGESMQQPDVVYMRPGSLDDTSGLEPIAHMWTRSAQPWIVIPDGVLQFRQQADDITQLIRAYGERG